MATLLGPDGRPIRKADLTREIAVPTLSGIRQIIGDHPTRGLTPAKLAGILREAEEGDATAYLELAEDMEEKDLHYVSQLGTRKRAVAQLDITVEAASDAREDEENAELVRGFLNREELEDELFDLLDAIGKGYSVTEIVWDLSESQWMPARLEWRPPQWFEIDRLDGRALRLKDIAGPQELAPYKFIVHRPKVKSGLPIRGGLARAASWCWLFKNYAIKDWVQFAEVYGQPVRVGKYNANALPEEKRTLLRAVSQIGTDAAAIIPELMMIEFVEAKSSGSHELHEKLADWLDRQVSKAVLGQTLTTEVQGGSLAAANVHNDVRGDIERADAKQLAAALNRDLVRPLIDLNRGPQKWYPRLRIGRPETVDSESMSNALSRLVPLGLRVRQAEVRRKLGLEEPDEQDELLSAPAVPAPADEGGDETAAASICPVHGRAHHAADASSRDNADEVGDRLEAATIAAMDSLVAPIRDLVDGAADLREVARRLIELHPQMDVASLADRLREALVLADLVGRAEVAEGG